MITDISIKPTDTLHDALQMMTKHDVSALAVVNEIRELVGIVSAKDFLRSYVSSKYLNGEIGHVEQYMTKNPSYIKYSDSVHTVINVFMEGSHHYYPVVDYGKFKGMLYRKSLLKEILDMEQTTW